MATYTKPQFKIAFGGKMRVGKSTAFEVIHNVYPHATEIAFAQPLKEMAAQVHRIAGIDPA